MMLVKEIKNKKWRWKMSITLTEKEIKEKLEEYELLSSFISSHYYKCFLPDDG
jgi:hypothetical protein